MKKTIALMLLCLALVVVLLASCSLTGDGGGEETDAPATTPDTTGTYKLQTLDFTGGGCDEPFFFRETDRRKRTANT